MAAEAIRSAVERAKFDHEGLVVTVTVSAGVAEVAPGDGPSDVYRRADERLYASKATGRNRVS